METKIENKLPEIKSLLKKYSVESAYLFGSAARKNTNQNSNYDFLVRFSSDLDYETYGNNYFNLLYSLQTLLESDVDLVAEETLSNPYLIQSINDSKILIL